MVDYNIKKVSPRPWVLRIVQEPKLPTHRRPIGMDFVEQIENEYIFDSKDHKVFIGQIWSKQPEDVLHSIHCVNHHEPLVEALEKLLEYTKKVVNGEYDYDDPAYPGAVDALTAAKGEADETTT